MADTIEILALFVLSLLGIIPIYIAYSRNKKSQSQYQQQFEELQQLPKTNKSISSFNPDIDRIRLGEDVGQTGVFRKFSITLNSIMAIAVVASFVFIILALALPDIAIATMIIGSTLFIPIGVLIGAITSSSMRVKMMRRFTGKNYGIVKFIHSNRLIKPVIANVDADIIRFSGGIYYLDKQSIKQEGSESLSDGIIHESKIKFEEGIPTIYYDITDIAPVDFATTVKKREDESNKDDKFRLPTQVSATLNKEIAVEKAKIMKSFKSQQSLMLLLILALVGINIFLSYTIYSNWDTMKVSIEALTARLATL